MTSDSSRSVGLVQSRLHELTHGESFLALLNSRFSDDDLSILDEPEATHRPITMALPDAWHDAMGSSSITRSAYEETEHYKVTKAFLDHPARSLRLLFATDEPADERPTRNMRLVSHQLRNMW